MFDWPSLRNRVGGDLVLLRELVAMFSTEYPLMLQQLQIAIERGEPLKVERVSHKLKGSLVQFSARAAAETAARLEDLGKRKSLVDAEAVVRTLEQQLQELVRALELAISQKVAEPRS